MRFRSESYKGRGEGGTAVFKRLDRPGRQLPMGNPPYLTGRVTVRKRPDRVPGRPMASVQAAGRRYSTGPAPVQKRLDTKNLRPI